EIDAGVTLEEFAAFLSDVQARLSGMSADTTLMRPERSTRIRVGAVGLREGVRDNAVAPASIATATVAYSLDEETDTVRWIHEEVAARDELPLLEAETVVRSLSVAMHGTGQIVVPLLRLKRFDQYTTTHSVNVAVLTMALAEALGFGAQDVRAFGTAGLLHDLGKVRVPKEILVKPGKLTDEERAVLNRHPVDGARIILEGDEHLGLAAAVAYEHHIMIDGHGYPQLHFRRECHYASRVVHVCDVFDALRTDRPYRAAWETERALQYIEERSGVEFDAEIAKTFVAMMRRLECLVTPLSENPPAPAAHPDPAAPLPAPGLAVSSSAPAAAAGAPLASLASQSTSEPS
ncbi:MAG TPA: HD domain-containing phosphohydrolase, partial [Gemmatimonadaceae bacterium]|nr:HD domain-containing phosphohydrolase [Gemmatimonadaceae bacterium]